MDEPAGCQNKSELSGMAFEERFHKTCPSEENTLALAAKLQTINAKIRTGGSSLPPSSLLCDPRQFAWLL